MAHDRARETDYDSRRVSDPFASRARVPGALDLVEALIIGSYLCPLILEKALVSSKSKLNTVITNPVAILAQGKWIGGQFALRS